MMGYGSEQKFASILKNITVGSLIQKPFIFNKNSYLTGNTVINIFV